MDRIEGVAAGLGWELSMAMGTARASLHAFQVVFAKLDAGDIGIEEAERLEQQLDDAGRLLSSVAAKHAALKLYIRKALVEAAAPNWMVENGGIFKIGESAPAD